MDAERLNDAVAVLRDAVSEIADAMKARGYLDAAVSIRAAHDGARSWIHIADKEIGGTYEFFTLRQFDEALAYAQARPRQPSPDDFAASIGIAPDGSFLDLCDDCGERPATETWDYSGAPIPNPPAPDHFCEPCADRRRDRSLEG
jgi:hypothetical protein